MIYGLPCPLCGSRASRNVRTCCSRVGAEEAIQRVRECDNGHRYWTREITAGVAKRNRYPQARRQAAAR